MLISSVVHARVGANDRARHIAAQCPKQHLCLPQVAAIPCPEGEAKSPEYVKYGGGVVGGAEQQGLIECEEKRQTQMKIK